MASKKDGKSWHMTAGHTGSVISVEFEPDGKHIASGSDDSTVWLWDARMGEAIGQPFEGHTDSVRSMTFSLDGTHIASGSDDVTVSLCSANVSSSSNPPIS
jgi:WD40 repeat protein